MTGRSRSPAAAARAALERLIAEPPGVAEPPPLLTPSEVNAALASSAGTAETRIEVVGETIALATAEGLRYELALAQLFERARPPLPDFVLPPGVRAVHPGYGGFSLALEFPPAVRRLRWGTRAGEGFAYREVALAFPYLVLITGVRFDPRGALFFEGWTEAYFGNAPLRSRADHLHLAPLLNVVSRREGHPTGGAIVCLGGFQFGTSGGGDPSEGLQQGLSALARRFLESGFNEDFERTGRTSAWNDPRSKPPDPRLASVEAWAEASAKDPAFVLEIPWVASPRTLGRALESVAEYIGVTGGLGFSSRSLQRLITRYGRRVDAASANPSSKPSSE